MNHPRIKFTEVTKLCEDTGQMGEGAESCTHAEVWVTGREEEADEEATANPAAVAIPRPRVTTNFRYTNGQTPTTITSSSRQVVET